MTISNLMKSIGGRILDCYIHIALFAVILLLSCLFGQGIYLIMVKMSEFTSDAWFGYAAKAFGITVFVLSSITFVVISAIIKYKLFKRTHEDVNRYLDGRRTLTK